MKKQTIRIHRVGSVTFGVVLVSMGVLSFMHMIFPRLEYNMVVRLWPAIFIVLGLEVLLGSRHKTYDVLDEEGKVIEQEKTVYDFAAIFLIMALVIFAMVLAAAEISYMNYQNYHGFYF